MATRRETRLPYMPGIDGLRAIAVLAVFVYHVGAEWMPGGFLGVDVFFAISGFLITALLLSEFRRNGYIDIKAFWIRRARRLLPAVAVMLAVVMVLAALVVPDEIAALRLDAVASLFYVNNWHQILADQSYFEEFTRPSLFTHLWSLAVEEQFYLLWPLAFAFGLRRFGVRHIAVGVGAAVIASAVLMAVLFDPAVNDGSRAFFGTDTRAAALFAGVGLALIWHPSQIPFRRSRRAGRALDALGVLALAMIVHTFATAQDFEPGLYRGGFLLLALWSVLLIANLAHPMARLGSVLGLSAFTWLGVRSYAFYLWHWPVLALTRPYIDVPMHGLPLVVLQLTATLALADLSYRFVERPFRRWNRAGRSPWALRSRDLALAASVVVAIIIAGWRGTTTDPDSIATASVAPPAPVAPASLAVGRLPATELRPRESAARPRRERGVDPRDEPRRHQMAASPPASAVPPVLAIGDSVMVAAEDELRSALSRVTIDAHESRQPTEYAAAIAARATRRPLPDHVVLQLGNNGPVYHDTLVAIKEELAGVSHVYLVSVEVPRSWEAQVNAELASFAADWPEATLVDWHGAINARPSETYDGIHPTPAGAALYGETIANAVR